ncbi:aldehyde dehydrogenase family protein [candidate division KSB1 bacterium]|nr:aldehyde dehydrogenase family protein [candidate division KSB1 bacterium]
MDIRNYPMLIQGAWRTSTNTLAVYNPYNRTQLATVPAATPEEVELAISGAIEAFPKMAQLPAHQRAQILEKTAQLLSEQQNEIARTIASEAGKAWKYALSEVQRGIQTFKFAAEEAKQIHGQTIPLDAVVGAEKYFGFYFRQPIGVIAAITPFNFPLNLVAHKVAPALAAGNVVILKPASYTPLTALRLGEILIAAGLPAGAISIVMGSGATVGRQLVTDPRISMVSFTGSPEVGQAIKSQAGLKRVTLELGSNSAVIIDQDAPLDLAVNRCVMGSFANSGQICISVQRIYVARSIFDTFLAKFLTATRLLVVGNPLDETCDVGPLIHPTEAERAETWVQEAVAGGAEIRCGGTRVAALMAPTVLTNVTEEMRVMRDEIFAPVVSIVPFDHFSTALQAVDNSRYGLQTGIFTQNMQHAFQAIQFLNVGGVIINDVPTFRADNMPYGGNKASGLGREGVKFAIEEMTNIKMVAFHNYER